MELTSRLKHAWNAFKGRDHPEQYHAYNIGPSYFTRPDRIRLSYSSERTVISGIYNRIAVDVAANKIVHARIDFDDNFVEQIDSKMNRCLTQSANIDQSGRAFIQDVAMSMLDEGCVAIVPVEAELSKATRENVYDILEMRCGKIKEWYPEHVKVEIFNQAKQRKDEITLPKKMVAIVENPFYSVMNEPNSTLQRLKRKMNLLDELDEKNSGLGGKLDLIIQLPYSIRSEARRDQAEKRRADIERQLSESKYGVAYADGTEKIVQLNRAVENQLLDQIKYYTEQLYAELSMTPEVLNGTATPEVMNNYYNRTIEPILGAIAEEMKRKFLSQTAITQRQTIMYIQDPFKLVPIDKLATVADTFTRNAILTSNELRGIIGKAPIDDPMADELSNKNLNGDQRYTQNPYEEEYPVEDYDSYYQEGDQNYEV